MSHVFNFKSKYSLIIEVDKQAIFDGPDPERVWFSSFSIDIKLFDTENKEISLASQQKDDIIAALSKIRSVYGD